METEEISNKKSQGQTFEVKIVNENGEMKKLLKLSAHSYQIYTSKLSLSTSNYNSILIEYLK